MARKAGEEWRKLADRRAAAAFGVWIARLRGQLTQGRLAERTGLSAALVSNVEAGRRRATDDYLRRLDAALEHSLGEWHLRGMRDTFYNEELSDAVREQWRDAALRSTEDDPVSRALHTEALSLARRVDAFGSVMRSYFAAVGRSEKFDPVAARESVEAEASPGAEEKKVAELERALRSARQVGHQESESPVSVTQDPGSERLRLVAELVGEIDHLSTAQLHRVIGFVAALPRPGPARTDDRTSAETPPLQVAGQGRAVSADDPGERPSSGVRPRPAAAG